MNTTYFLNCVSGNLFHTKTSPALPAKYFIGLSSTAPNAGGTGATEPNANAGYARVELTTLSAPADGVATNTKDINFAESTSDWGRITHFVVYDAATGGNLLIYGELNAARNVEAATVMTIKEGYLKLAVQNPTVCA